MPELDVVAFAFCGALAGACGLVMLLGRLWSLGKALVS